MGSLGARYFCRQARRVVQRGSDEETGRGGSHAWHGNLVSLRFNTDIASPLPRASYHRQGTSTMRITHFTLATTSCLRPHPQHFGTAHLTTVETYSSCVNSRQAKALSTAPAPNLQRAPFHYLQLALLLNPQPCFSNILLYWGIHIKGGLLDCAKLLVLNLFDDCNNCISTGIFLKV